MWDNTILSAGLTILVFLLISAFFSAAETALTAVSRARIYQLVMEGNKRAQMVSRLRREKESLISTILLGNNVVNIAASAIATSLSIQIFGNEGAGLLWVTLLMTFLVVVCSEIVPKTYAITHAESVALRVSPALNLIVKLFYPVTRAIQLLIQGVFRLFGVDMSQQPTLISATDVIRGTIELHHREGKMIKHDRDMLGSILDLDDITVEDIMVHRKHVDMIDIAQPPDVIIQQAFDSGHSRIPLWEENSDNVIGMLHVKDLIPMFNAHRDRVNRQMIRAILQTPWFIPESTTLRDQLLAFRAARAHFALVVDEYGALRGIVTLEDIIEEIVGNIDDEHDEIKRDIRKVGEQMYLLSGDVSIRDINRELDWNLPDEDASTIAGLVMHVSGRIPSIGEEVISGDYRFRVVERSINQITRVRAQRMGLEKNEAEDSL